MLSQDQEERYTHQCIDHLRRVGFLYLILFIDAAEKVDQFRILSCLKLKIGGRTFSAQGFVKKLGEKVINAQLVPENTFERAGTDHVEHQHGVIFITGAGVHRARRNDQYVAPGRM